MEKDKILKSIEDLYNDIENCIVSLINARVNKDTDAEGKALFKMESLMVDCQQELTCLHDILSDGVVCDGRVYSSTFTSYMSTPGIEEMLHEKFPKDTDVVVYVTNKSL